MRWTKEVRWCMMLKEEMCSEVVNSVFTEKILGCCDVDLVDVCLRSLHLT